MKGIGLRWTVWSTLNETVSTNRLFYSVCLVAWGINKKKQERQTHYSQITTVDRLFGPFSLTHPHSLSSSPSFYITNSSLHLLNCDLITPSFDFSPVSPPALAELLELQETGHISSSVAKQVSQLHRPCNYPLLSVTHTHTHTPQLVFVCVLTCLLLRLSQVFQEMWRSSGKTAPQIIQDQNLGLVSDTAQLHSICQKVLDSHPDEVTSRFSPVITLLLYFACVRCFVVPLCRFTPSEMETRKF